MKRPRTLLIVVIVVIVVCLVATGAFLGIRSLMSRLGATTTINPVNTLIYLVPGLPTPTPTMTPIELTPNPTTLGTDVATPTATSATAPTAAIPASTQPCDNFLYPVKPGAQWAYQANARGASYEVDMSVLSVTGQQAMVSLVSQATHITSQAAVDCDNGAIRSFPVMTVGMLFGQSVNGTMTVQYVAGTLAPSQPTFAASNWNYTWTGDYLLTGNGTARFQGNSYTLSLNRAPMHLTCHTTGTGSAAFVPLTVTAGSFPSTLKVVCTFQTQATLNLNGASVTGTVTGGSTQWFAPEIGLLKLQTDYANLQYLIFNVPLNVAGGLELKGYQIPH